MGVKVGKEKKVFEKILKLMGFVKDRVGKHGEVWKHYAKNLIHQLPISPSGMSWVNNNKSKLTKLITDNFSKEDIELFLQPLIKKRKVQFTKDGRMRLLRISGDLELNMLRDLLIDDMPINQELQEFSDGKDDDEMDDLYEKVKDISFKVLKKDKRKTKIEDEEN
jgi:hypothetical protein